MIDWTRVNELRDEVGAEDFSEVTEMFLEEADEAIARLKTGHQPDMFESDFHALKGSALNLGFQDFAAICSEQEKLAASGAVDAIDVTSAIDSYHASKTLLMDYLREEAA